MRRGPPTIKSWAGSAGTSSRDSHGDGSGCSTRNGCPTTPIGCTARPTRCAARRTTPRTSCRRRSSGCFGGRASFAAKAIWPTCCARCATRGSACAERRQRGRGPSSSTRRWSGSSITAPTRRRPRWRCVPRTRPSASSPSRCARRSSRWTSSGCPSFKSSTATLEIPGVRPRLGGPRQARTSESFVGEQRQRVVGAQRRCGLGHTRSAGLADQSQGPRAT